MKLYLAGGMSYRELLFGGAIMDLYLAIGGGQWNKYVAPTLKEIGGKSNENVSGSSRGGDGTGSKEHFGQIKRTQK